MPVLPPGELGRGDEHGPDIVLAGVDDLEPSTLSSSSDAAGVRQPLLGRDRRELALGRAVELPQRVGEPLERAALQWLRAGLAGVQDAPRGARLRRIFAEGEDPPKVRGHQERSGDVLLREEPHDGRGLEPIEEQDPSAGQQRRRGRPVARRVIQG